MKTELTNCPICDMSTWESLDYLRDHKYWYDKDLLFEDEPVGFKVCKHCGFVTYDYMDTERLKQRYSKERGAFDPAKIQFFNRKKNFTEIFLDEIYLSNDNEYLKVLDIGAANGYLLDMLEYRYVFERYNLYGTEFSKGYRNFGKYEYGFDIREELDDELKNNKYDLIMYYHVLEHIQNPKEELLKAKSMLNIDGMMYISVPIWFDELEETSLEPISSFEHYYHLNHVNVFSKNSFENLLKKCGLEIIKVNHSMYGYTVLVKVGTVNNIISCDDFEEIKQSLEAQKQAIHLYGQGDNEGAISAYTYFPEAYLKLSVDKNNMKELELQIKALQRGLDIMPNNWRLLDQMAKVYFQFDQNTPQQQRFYSNNIIKAEQLFNKALELKPTDAAYFFLAHIEGIYKKNYDKACELMKRFYELNPLNYIEAYRFIGLYRKEQE